MTEYTIAGAAWLASVVEDNGGDFATYTKERIFERLGMTSTAWFAGDYSSPQQLDIGYWAYYADERGWNSPYPIGNLRSTSRDS